MRQPLKTTLIRMVNVTVLGLYLNSMTFTAWADAVTAGSSEGQSVGQQVLQAFDGGDASVTLQDLFPDLGDTASLEKVYGDDVKTIDMGIQANTRLKSESSAEGDAYRTLIDSGNRLSVDLSKDPMLNQADKVRSAEFMDGFKQNFSDCKRTDVFETVTKNAHVANYKTCERVVDQGGSVEFTHDYKVGVVEYVSGQPNFQSCGVGCLYIWVGTVGDNYWSGQCKIFEEYTRFRVLAKDSIISATVDNAVFDDYFQVMFDDEVLWSHTPGVFPPETAGGCERSTNWNVSPGADITEKFTDSNDVITFKTRTSVTGRGEGYARIKIIYDPAKAFVDNGWGPKERLPMFNMIDDGFCKDSQISCTSMPDVDANGCIEKNGARVCGSDMPPSPHSSIDPLCEKATVSAECSFYKGPMECYTDANGNEQCPTNGAESCGVNHDIKIASQALVGRFAANGRDIATAELDFVSGTWKTISPSDGTLFNGSVSKANYKEYCTDKVSQIDSMGIGLWPEHGLGGILDTSINQRIIQAPTCENGLKAIIQIQDTKSDGDLEFVLSGEVRFRMSKIESDVWTPQSCVNQGKAVLNGECTSGSIKVTKGVESEGECGTIAGVHICPGSPLYDQIKASPLGTSRLAEQIRVTGCGTTSSRTNTCTKYEENPSCGFISQGCIEGTKGESGSCYAFEEIWDCGYDTSYETIVNTGSQIDCPGGARCMGSECFDTSNTKSGDFAYAVAMLQVAQFAEHDLDCGGDGTDINEANECKIFKGDAMECKKALGGYVDCCEAPESVSIFDYVNLTMNTLKMTSSLEALNRTGSLFSPGYWAAGSNAVMAAGTSVVKGQWGSVVDAATGAFEKTLSGTLEQTALSKLQTWLMQKAYDAMVEMGAGAAADAVFATGADGAVTGLGANAAMVLNIIGWVYMVYVIVDLLINIIWECEEKEFELGAKKETRQCHFVGSYCASEVLGSCVEKREAYCCFGSVVARIIQESAREQLGLGWGETKTPSCEGITPAQMAKMDWTRVDLSEWIGMLNLAGRLPTASTVSLEDVTGGGSGLGGLSEGTKRLNTLDRNLERLNGFDVDGVKKQYEKDLK